MTPGKRPGFPDEIINKIRGLRALPNPNHDVP